MPAHQAFPPSRQAPRRDANELLSEWLAHGGTQALGTSGVGVRREVVRAERPGPQFAQLLRNLVRRKIGHDPSVTDGNDELGDQALSQLQLLQSLALLPDQPPTRIPTPVGGAAPPVAAAAAESPATFAPASTIFKGQLLTEGSATAILGDFVMGAVDLSNTSATQMVVEKDAQIVSKGSGMQVIGRVINVEPDALRATVGGAPRSSASQ